MILIPQKLFDQQEVTVILQDGNVCILEKTLTQSLIKREGYISNHAIAILLAGTQQIQTYDAQLILVKAKEVLFIPRGMYHITDLLPQNGQFKSLLFYFDDSIIQAFLSTIKISDISRKSVPAHLIFDCIPAIETFAESLISMYKTSSHFNKHLLHLKILELLHLLHTSEAQATLANFLFQLSLPKKRNIKSFMEHNFSKPLKMEDYAYLTGRSMSTFRRDFKFYYATTPQKWLKERRLEKALKIVKEKDITVTQLAYEVGYENISYFIKEFKAHVGLSPKQYILSQNRNNLLD